MAAEAMNTHSAPSLVADCHGQRASLLTLTGLVTPIPFPLGRSHILKSQLARRFKKWEVRLKRKPHHISSLGCDFCNISVHVLAYTGGR